MARILAIDDEPDVLTFLTVLLSAAGHVVHGLEESSRFEQEICEFQPDLAILDIMMPGVTGGSLYTTVRRLAGPHVPVIFFTASSMKVRTAGQDDLLAYCRKPASPEQLLEVVDRMLGLAQAQRTKA